VKPFIEEMFGSVEIDQFWADEILTSILLSDYSKEFFLRFKGKILDNDFALLRKILFLLRVSCKSIDDAFTKSIGAPGEVNLNYVFTKPKGSGWRHAIDFINQEKRLFDVSKISFLIPLLVDWCDKNKRGQTTRAAGLFALKFYGDTQSNKQYRYRSENFDKQLIKIIIHSSGEIKDELNKIFGGVFEQEQLNNQTPYYDLCKEVIGSNFDNISIAIALPDQVLKLAELFWLEPKKRPEHYYGGYGTEKYYGLNEYGHHSYSPASAYQTPIYWLLKFAFPKTIDFILDFTNRTIKKYSQSGFDDSSNEIEIIIGENEIRKQYLSHALWNMYRGTSSPVAPYLLQSIHMALEKYLLELAKSSDPKALEPWLIYLLRKSESASLTAVVTSVVLAHPGTFFSVAKILFSSPHLLLFDRLRARMTEHQTKSLYSIGVGLDYRSKIFEDERLKTCEDRHRKLSLEDLIIQYQFFRDEDTPEEEVNQRQEDIWNILDRLHSKFPDNPTERTSDKTIRLLLAGIDRRTMKPKVEATENSFSIEFNPQIAPELEAYSKEAVDASNKMMKYTALKLWSGNKFDNPTKSRDYPQYENDPALVLKEIREIIAGLEDSNLEYNYYLFNHSIPAFACSALIREYSSNLTKEDRELCIETIIGYSTAPFRPDYDYQISDGVEVAVNALPYIIEQSPEIKDECLIILLLILFDLTPIGHYKRVCDYSIESIQRRLSHTNPDNAIKIISSYLKFRPIFQSVIDNFKSERPAWRGYPQHEIIKKFTHDNEKVLEDFFSSPIQQFKFDPEEYELEDLEILFHLIPYDTVDPRLVELTSKMLPFFAEKLLKEDKEIEYLVRVRILKRVSHFILFRETKDVENSIKPFVDHFSVSEEMKQFLEDFISTEDQVQQYEQFWIVWNAFYEKVKNSMSFAKDYRFSGLLHAYLLAWPWWKETADSWHSLKEREATFYRNLVKDLGYNSSTLDSIAQFLNQIGSGFLNEGIFWLSEMIAKNDGSKLEVNTVFYLEKLLRKYVHLNRFKIKQDVKLKHKILIILDFLVEQSSVNAYLLREDIL
jgi:hypothetical protein